MGGQELGEFISSFYTLSACCSQELEGEGAEPQGRKQHGEERAGGSDTIGLISMLNKGDGGGGAL